MTLRLAMALVAAPAFSASANAQTVGGAVEVATGLGSDTADVTVAVYSSTSGFTVDERWKVTGACSNRPDTRIHVVSGQSGMTVDLRVAIVTGASTFKIDRTICITNAESLDSFTRTLMGLPGRRVAPATSSNRFQRSDLD
jgi:hypothetical protein